MKNAKFMLVLFVLFVFTAVTNTDQVKIFSEPTPSSMVIEVLRLGDVVKVYQKSPDGQYFEVEHKGNHGWIIFKYLSPKDHRYSTET
ncbi:SH3 domain-containing protein [Sporomusa sp.]|uniref:SH3 domain-containing protein n=1 Tax=Sporomusa sp. TaxID=2078658 RepID=UPI002B5C1CFD|nr:SH3 domain-containing protein [Sporomusa sp.]HWR09260.1 SH3 domain-containing protein [Sporomusa sp.]